MPYACMCVCVWHTSEGSKRTDDVEVAVVDGIRLLPSLVSHHRYRYRHNQSLGGSFNQVFNRVFD